MIQTLNDLKTLVDDAVAKGYGAVPVTGLCMMHEIRYAADDCYGKVVSGTIMQKPDGEVTMQLLFEEVL